MATRLPSLLQPAIGFAHRGARAHARENTLEAFELALRLGATGLESDAYLTADGEVVLDHDGLVGRWPRRSGIHGVARDRLPGHIPTLEQFYETVGGAAPLALDLKDPATFEPVVACARRHDAHAQLWLCHGDLELLKRWRAADPTVRLVHSTRKKNCAFGLERHAAMLAEERIDVLNLPAADWTGGNVALVHRFGRYAFGWGAQLDRVIASLFDMGIDGVFSDWSDRLADVLRRAGA